MSDLRLMQQTIAVSGPICPFDPPPVGLFSKFESPFQFPLLVHVVSWLPQYKCASKADNYRQQE